MTTHATEPLTESTDRLDDIEPPDATSPVLSRRSLLKRLGLAGTTVLVAGTGAPSYRVYDNGVLDPGSGAPYDPWSRWRTDPSPLGAVGAAILAANPHNTQPWTFRVTSMSVDVFSDPSRGMPAVDPYDREHNVGLGCAIENLVLTLRARGYQPTVTLMPEAADQTHVAALTLTRTASSTSPLYEAIGDRHSNRGPYLNRAVPSGVLDELTGPILEVDTASVRWFTATAQKQALSQLIVRATEAFSWFRNNRDDIEKHRDGPTLDAQGLDPITLTVAKLLPASSRSAEDAFWLDQTRTVHTATAAAYGVITVLDTDDITARLTSDRRLQRIHLPATARGVALQHMNQVTERIDRERQQGRPPVFAQDLAQLIAQPDRAALVTFRVGYPVRKARLSPRRPLSEVTR